MDFISLLIAYASTQWIDENRVYEKHESYCQNLYWQPDAEQKMSEYGCDIYKTDREVVRVISGKY